MNLCLENEAYLIERAKSDPDAFIALYEHYFPYLYRYSYYRTKSKQETEDVVSQTFLKALENIAGFKQKGIPFGCWLYRIAANIMYHNFKHKNREYSLNEHLFRTELEIMPEQLDLLRYLDALPEAQQQVLTLRYIQDLSIRDVARIINRSEGAVKQLALRGLRALRERVDENEG